MSGLSPVFCKATSKIAKTALKCPPVYRMAIAAASRRCETLPTTEAAAEILNAASPKPKYREAVEPRYWPGVPEVDISVIVPCYNVERFVEGCVRSIAGQKTTRSFEIIAVDDGSTDKTGAILDSLAGEIENLRVIHQTNRGFSGARNVGIANAAGGGSCLCRL